MSSWAPIRVIYAKLTSTGSYDVVALTPNIPLEQARATAEGLRLGDVPADASFSEAVAYLRPAEGGHLVARFKPYPWRDPDGREPLMTDLVWLSDEDFARVRRNAFVLVQENERTFATRETLDGVELPTVSAESEMQRIAQLAPRVRNFATFTAAVLSTDRLLVLEPDPSDNIELLTLLLPPILRDRLTFQTRAYDVPAPAPRVTATDRFRASLQRGNWQRVLPDDAELPPTVASRLVDCVSAPQTLFRAHEVYERIPQVSDNLAAEAARLIRLVDFAEKLDNSQGTEALRYIARAEAGEAQLEIAELEARLSPRQIGDLLTALLEDESADPVVAQFFEHARAGNAKPLAAWTAAAANVLITSRRTVDPRLAALLTTQLVEAGDADRLLAMLSRFHRELAGAALQLPAGTPPALNAYVEAQLGRGRTRAVGAAVRVVSAAADLHSLVRGGSALKQLADGAVESVHAALHALTLMADDVAALRELQKTIDAASSSVTWLSDLSALLLTPRFLEGARSHAEVDAAVQRLSTRVTPEALAAVAASLLVSAAERQEGFDKVARAARSTLLALGRGPLAERLPAVLDQLGVRSLALWELPGLEDVLPLLGDTARVAGDTRRLALALNRLADDPAAIGDVAAVVMQLRLARSGLTNDPKVLEPIIDALSGRNGGAESAAALELALELIATIADTPALRTIENAVLSNPAGVSVRLRRLDRAVQQCQTACDESVYDALVRQLEVSDGELSDDARQRLRQALGVKTLQYRVSKGIENVLSRRRT